MRVLITGGAGFIGSNLAGRLLGAGHRLAIADNLDDFYDPGLKRANLGEVARHGAFEFDEVDICDPAAAAGIVGRSRPDAIVHLAARVGVRPSLDEPLLYERVNVQGTISMLEAARRAGVPKVVLASSSSVYGNSSRVPFSETDTSALPVSPYGATKLAAEKMCAVYAHLYGISITCLRFFTVYGPRQRPDLAIRKFTALIDAGRPVPFYGDGTTSRDYTYVDDTVSGIVSAIGYRGEPFSVFNLGNSTPVTLAEMVRTIEEALGKKAVLERLPAQMGDMPVTCADVTRAREHLGFAPETPFAKGVSGFVEWYRR